jgi:hypothetical protein
MSSNRMQNTTKVVSQPSCKSIQRGSLQRKCACGQHIVAGSECAECRKKREEMLHKSAVKLMKGHT